MKILHLTRDFGPPVTGGISTAVTSLIRALSHDRDARQLVISFDAWRPAAAGVPAPLSMVDDGSLRIARAESQAQLPAVRQLMNDFAPDIVHLHDPLFEELAFAPGVPVVAQLHVYHHGMCALLNLQQPTLSMLAEERALARAAVVVAPNPEVAAAAGAKWGIEVRTIVHGHDVWSECRPEMGPDNSENHVAVNGTSGFVEESRLANRPAWLWTGRFSWLKGADRLVDIAANWTTRFPDRAPVRVIGGCPENGRAERKWMRRLREVSRENIDLPGWRPAYEVQQALRSGAPLVVTSRYETFGLGALDAVRSGAPLVISRAPGLAWLVNRIAETFADYPLCIVENPDDADAWVQAIEEAIARQGGVQPPALSAMLPSWAQVAVQWMALYRETLKGANRE